MRKATILGAGSWGTALATVLTENNYTVSLWTRNDNDAIKIMNERENKKYLPGVRLDNKIEISTDLEKTLKGSTMVVFAVPSHAVRETVKMAVKYIEKESVIVNTAKGLEIETFARLSEILEQELPADIKQKIAVLSGPSHAEEVGKKIPTAIVVASHNKKTAEFVQDSFMTPFFRVYTNPDVIGVELGGALKNIIALATGISDGLGFGDNSKAALMTRGITEIVRLGMKMGAQPMTFSGLSGVGDLIVTCTSIHSRNRRAGIALGKGKPLQAVLKEVGMVVEGVKTTRAVFMLAQKINVEMPITAQVYDILYREKNPRQGVEELMQRNRKHEIEEVVKKGLNW